MATQRKAKTTPEKAEAPITPEKVKALFEEAIAPEGKKPRKTYNVPKEDFEPWCGLLPIVLEKISEERARDRILNTATDKALNTMLEAQRAVTTLKRCIREIAKTHRNAPAELFNEDERQHFSVIASELENWIAAAPSFTRGKYAVRNDWHFLASYAYAKFAERVKDHSLSKEGPHVRFVKSVVDLAGFEEVTQEAIYKFLEREKAQARKEKPV